ncbi:hypothetical protein G9A89_005622 [Geosiphon pyriformis]|nr:hypothetical protein G9A89_005622 [Geosiphon pyriformis]
MEPVGVSAGGSGSDSAGLGTHQSAKNKCVDTVYSRGASYKKSKKPAAGVLVESSTGPLCLKNLGGNNGASTPSKFPGVICSTFTSESSLIKARELAVHEKIVVNSDLKKANIHLNWEVIIKEIPVDLLKLAVELVFSKFGKIISIRIQLIGLWQKALIEFESSEVASLVASKWSVLVGKDSVRVALAVNNKQMWALLYTLLVGTSAHDLSDLLVSYGGKTCFIGCNPGSYVHNRCAIICFKNEDARLAAVSTVPIFKGVSLHWASLVLASCTKYIQFSHTTTNCSVSESSGVHRKKVVSDQDWVCLAGIYKKKSASIAHPVLFGGKTWAQIASDTSFRVSLFGSSGSGLCVGLVPPSAVSDHLVVSYLNDCLAVLECSLELLADHVSGILIRLDSFGVIPLVPSSLALSSVVSAALSSEVDSDMIVDNALSSSDITPPITIDAVVDFSTSSSKVLTAKMGGLETKLVTLEASVGSVLDKLNLLCSDSGLSVSTGINNCAKQADIVCWHKDMNNMVSIVTETKLKGKIYPWIADKFDGVCVFTSELDSGHMESGVAIIMDSSLVRHVCKVSEVPGWLLLVRLLFKKKLSVFILGLYAGASLATVNESSFVIFSGDFNENGSHRCASFKKCFDLGLINSLGESSFMNITKMIDYVLIFSNLVGAVVDRDVNGIEDYFDTDYKTVSVFVGLGGLLNVELNSLYKQANRNHWKYDIKNANEVKWSEFRNAIAANVVMFLDEFVVAKQFSDLDAILDSVNTLPVRFLFFSGAGFDAICSGLAKTKKSYRSSKLLESKCAEEFCIKQAIKKRMESFEMDKGHTIRSVLERPFCKVMLDYLVDGRELVLEPELIKSKVDGIMKGWTRKRVARQFWSLDYVFNGAFSDVIHLIGFNEMFGVISNLPNKKAAGLSGITNELWKHCDKSVLDMLLVLLNFCLNCKKVWVLMIPKPYKWEGVLINTHPIALIETARKVLFKIFSDRISLACSTFNVFRGDNFSVLKSMSTQLPIFAIGSHLKRSLIRIKMCNKFIRFFGSIHNSHTNKVMTDFGLTNEYYVHDGLDQRKVFLPLFWCIFYDLLLCKVKRQKSICEYRLVSHFISKTGRVESQAGLMLFLTASAFVNDTIWVGSSQAATQHILNVASNFFCLNDISINNDKTVAISINCQVAAPYLTISGLPISITKRGEPHHYLEIFLFSEGFLKPSLVKVYSDVWFFVNLILRKVISDKQFAYLVSSVLFPIISYRTQFSFISLNGLKSKFGLPLDFPNNALYHPSLYNLKTFKQIQTKSKLASVIAFANSIGVLGCLFFHRSHNLQVLSWHSRHSLLFSVCVRVSSSNNFLAGVVCIFSGCDLSLGGSLAVLGKTIFFKCIFSLRHYGIAFVEQLCDQNSIFDLSVHFLGGVAFPSGHSPHESVCGSSDICQSLGFSVICNDLLNVGATHLFMYTDGSLSNLGTVDMLAGAVVFFEDIGLGLGVGMSGLVFSTLTELQAIALALECVPSSYSVDLFSDSQAALDACKFEFLLICLDFRNQCWIKQHHIANVIHRKNLDVNWVKVRGHLGVLDNECANLPYLISECFLKAGGTVVSGNSRHFVRDVFQSVHRACWKIGSGSKVSRSSLVWHPDSHIALHHCLSVAVQKCLYDKSYPSVVCLFCGEVKVSDHVFSCSSDADSHASLLDTYAAA